ncbi:Protein IMPACT [Escovopsis weberi]|uniref:Protein IMPACT n=1 Tax=Escovopsis weberi TaxID=150374 RepID=A0A0M8MS07_ESCWE|nr:Protein IMPACT [Escovopsis weberi]
MAGHGDLQEMLRMLTARKASMMAAMGYIKALQAKNLKSIEQIANAPLSDIEDAIKDAKLAKSFHAACKYHGKKGKRAAEEAVAPAPAKKQKLETHKRDLDYASMTPDEIETSLELPLEEDEGAIRSTVVVTNRAPLLLAFAVELLRFTMPEQPLSSRLSLAQAVVSANSRSKAISVGIEKAPAGGGAHTAEGQPKVRVMGREIPVLKRSGYTWTKEESDQDSSSSSSHSAAVAAKTWTTSQKRTSKASTFMAHAATVSSPSLRPGLIKTLMTKNPELQSATHNAWAIRTSFGDSPLVQEASFDDGESGCGKFLLEAMRGANVRNTLVVLTRWYGGVLLGQDRWRLMRECVDDALSSQQRTFTFSGEALWGLDPDDQKPAMTTIGMAIHRPEVSKSCKTTSGDCWAR